jgi:FkbM family methyltransferase
MSTVNELVRSFKRKWDFLSVHPAFRLAPMQTTLRLASWRTKCFLRTAATIQLRNSGVRMFLPPNWRGVAKLIYAFRHNYEPELDYLASVLSPGKVFVDAGANFGIYSLLASHIVGQSGRVISFEPSIRAFPVLQQNIALNGFKNVLAFPIALTQESGRQLLYHDLAIGCDTLGRYPPSQVSSEEVATESLDDVLRRAAIDRVDVIKMDVQGAEELVLRGASNTLSSSHPVIIFEVWPEGAALLDLPPNGAWELLESAGYEFCAAAPGGTLSPIKSPPAVGNVVAIYGGRKETPGYQVEQRATNS